MQAHNARGKDVLPLRQREGDQPELGRGVTPPPRPERARPHGSLSGEAPSHSSASVQEDELSGDDFDEEAEGELYEQPLGNDYVAATEAADEAGEHEHADSLTARIVADELLHGGDGGGNAAAATTATAATAATAAAAAAAEAQVAQAAAKAASESSEQLGGKARRAKAAKASTAAAEAAEAAAAAAAAAAEAEAEAASEAAAASIQQQQPPQPKPKPKAEAVAGAAAARERGAFYVAVQRPARVQAAREGLPIFAEEQRIMESVAQHDALILCGETGSGKTTQLPQFLIEAGYGHPDAAAEGRSGMVGITQPRRVAAVAMAQRVAHELGDELGGRVAYQVRYESTVKKECRVKFMTEGILMREVAQDLMLSQYSCLVLDEAHERGVNTDILLGILSRVLRLRAQRWQQQQQQQQRQRRHRQPQHPLLNRRRRQRRSRRRPSLAAQPREAQPLGWPPVARRPRSRRLAWRWVPSL